LATSTDLVSGTGWVEARGDLYHGIPCRIRIAPGDHDAVHAGWQVLERIDQVFNVHRDNSELGAINAAGPGRHVVSPWLAGCLQVAQQVESLSGGAWCATMLPLMRLWRQATRAGVSPDPRALQAAHAVCTQAWELDGRTLTLRRAGAAFDLGGVAKGYAVDLVVDLLRARGISDLLVQVGGETACLGRCEDGGPHHIGIPHPDDAENAWCAVLRDPGEGLCGSTSGDYRQPLLVAGTAHHHVLDPRTGQPASAALASVTCAFPGTGRNALSDGLSTAATVLGTAALAPLAAATGAAFFALRRDGERGLMATATPGWSRLLADDRA
jgi:thiamine biosynthesis lipoprotein